MISTRSRPPARAPAHRRPGPPRFPGSAVVVLIGSLLLGALLNAGALAESAGSLAPGPTRSVMVIVTHGLEDAAHLLRLDLPRRYIERMLEPTATTVAPPPTTPTPATTVTPPPATTVTPPPTTTVTPPPASTSAPPTTPSTTATTITPPTTPIVTVPTTPPTAPTTLPGVFVPTGATPARLWVTGDSLTESFGPALVNLVAETGVVEARRQVEYSSGLTRPDFFDWPAFLEDQIADHPTEILVFMIGANDGQPIQVEGEWIPFDTEAWLDEYRRRVAETMDLLSERVATTYWIGQPVARSTAYSHKMEVMNQIYSEEAARHVNIRYVDSWQLFLDDSGAYAAYLADLSGRVVLMRRTDGIHLTPEGGLHLAREVLSVIDTDWHLTAPSQ